MWFTTIGYSKHKLPCEGDISRTLCVKLLAVSVDDHLMPPGVRRPLTELGQLS